MKALAFIDHPYHKLTNSSNFLLELLKQYYTVDCYYDNMYGNGNVDINKLKDYDINFYWQIVPQTLHKNIIWAPMFDYVHYIDNISNIKYICFSKNLYDEVIKKTSKAIYIQYWKKPEIQANYEKPIGYFWKRINTINWNIIKKLIGDFEFLKFYIKNYPDPGHDIDNISSEDINKYNIEVIDKYLSVEQHNLILKECNIMFAPRQLEGIGMLMLESFALGHCVVAYDAPTMNEYIANNQTGILYKNIESVNLTSFKQLGENTYNICVKQYQKWEQNKNQIIDFMES